MKTNGKKLLREGLSGTALKGLALVLMLLDHIAYFFDYTGLIPVWFHMAGRLAAPLFLFCTVEGFVHTHNRKRYYLRILLISALMGGLEFAMLYAGVLVRPDGFFPLNAIMMAFAVLIPVWQGIDWLREKKFGRGIAVIGAVVLWPLAAGMFLRVPVLGTVLAGLGMTVLPMWPMVTDGGLPFLLGGVLLYLFRPDRKRQAVIFAVFTFLYEFCLVAFAAVVQGGAPFTSMFTDYYEWMGIFAVFFMLCYNGKRGTGHKNFFYLFYPAHVYLLYALSWLPWLFKK